MITKHLLSRSSTWQRGAYRYMATTGGSAPVSAPAGALASAPAERRAVVAVTQMSCTADKEANRAQAVMLMEKAKARGAQMVFLPECFDMVGESRAESLLCAEPLEGDIVSFYRQYAKDNRLWLSLGGLHERPADFDRDMRLYNTHLLIDSSGDIQGTYRKTHLFNVDIKDGVRLKETDHTRPGPEIGPPVQTPAGRVGLAICYDMRFAELSLALREQGADILTFPSAFTVPTGMAHWHTLLRARAIETQCYVVAAAQVGRHNAKRSSYGHALIVDPWGAVIAECSDKVDVAVAEVDLDYLDKRRREMPVTEHRRHDLYGCITLNQACSIDSAPSYPFGQVSVPSSAVFYRTPLTYAFVNRKPVLAGHVLVSPLRSAERFSELSSSEVADLWLTVQKVAKVLEAQHGASSVSLAIQDGPEAGQTIKHVHVHVLPRKKGDFAKNDDIYDKLESHDKQVAAGEWRTDADMAKEASTLRLLFT